MRERGDPLRGWNIGSLLFVAFFVLYEGGVVPLADSSDTFGE